MKMLASWITDVRPTTIGALIAVTRAKMLLTEGHPDRLAVREAVMDALRPHGLTPYMLKGILRLTR